MINKILILFILFTSFLVISNEDKDLYSFSSNDNKERFFDLEKIYRCPKCQSSSLAGSNSPIAKDLKSEIHRLIEEGKTDKEIEAFLRSRYGEFIIYTPAFRKNTLILWLGPFFLLLVIFIWVVIWNFPSSRKRQDKQAENVVKALERTRLKKLLGDD